ncbi:hypothetical protein CDL15_Pgr027329 [Punica granatum]|uniref:Uncharacterized protein n=1 Tax=Punica granatum TaxID=22663 RepID=A0A218WCX0_PUNGR|nr:hypothetical protein CDL15_Pgr027329 [Punica granatum]
MGPEAEPKSDSSISTKLQLSPVSLHKLPNSPERSGLRTPPFHTIAAVPFRWEEEPGKPLPCTAIIPLPSHNNSSPPPPPKCLVLPPRLLKEAIIAKMPLPAFEKRSTFHSTSFRIGGDCYGSFRESPNSGYETGKRNVDLDLKLESAEKRMNSSWWGRKLSPPLPTTESERGGNWSSCAFPSFSTTSATTSTSRNGSSSTIVVEGIQDGGRGESESQGGGEGGSSTREELNDSSSRKMKKNIATKIIRWAGSFPSLSHYRPNSNSYIWVSPPSTSFL